MDKLTKLVDTTISSSCFTSRIYGREQQQKDQDGDDGNHHQQFDKGKTLPLLERLDIEHSSKNRKTKNDAKGQSTLKASFNRGST